MTEPSSPLTIANPDSLSLLFDPARTSYSDADLTTLIHELRRRRSEFQSAEAAKALAPKREKKLKPSLDPATAAKMDKPASEIDLEDL